MNSFENISYSLLLALICITPALVGVCRCAQPVHDFCKTGVKSFKVLSAFKVQDWLGLFGEVTYDNSGTYSMEAFRVFYNEMGDKSERRDQKRRTPYYYFDAKYWPEMKALAIDSKAKTLNISYSFSTTHLIAFTPQSTAHLAYLTSSSSGLTTVYDINSNRPISEVQSLLEPSFEIIRHRVVYDANTGEDTSRKLTLKILLLHFPKTVKIIDILIFDRKPKDAKKSIYHALVYTEEKKGGKWYYMRHLMKSVVKEYVDHMLRQYERLYWSFDEKNHYCHVLAERPSAVVYLRTEQSYTGFSETEMDDRGGANFVVYFIEFFETEHYIQRLHFDISTDEYYITKVGLSIPNRHMLFCGSHPDFKSEPIIPCDDYPIENIDQLGSYDSAEGSVLSAPGSDSGWTTFWVWTGIVVFLLLILNLIGFSLYLYSTQKTQNEEISDN